MHHFNLTDRDKQIVEAIFKYEPKLAELVSLHLSMARNEIQQAYERGRLDQVQSTLAKTKDQRTEKQNGKV